jgi:putative transposase
MAKQRKTYSAAFKFQVALEAAQGQQTINELASRHGVHPHQIGQWKRQLLEQGPEVFNGQTLARHQKAQQGREAQLYEQIGRLQVELEWLKKNLPFSLEVQRAMIDLAHPQLSVRRKCDLIDLHRSSF